MLPAWYPDAKHLLFSPFVEGNRLPDLKIMDADGTNVKSLNVKGMGAALSPDGTGSGGMGKRLSSGFGFGMGAGLGAKLAAPHREVIVTVGDGSYMFGNPLPYHFVQKSESLPTLTVVANNQQWLAVRQSTLDVFPDGAAAKANVMALTELKPSPDYEKVVETCGGKGEKVEGPGNLLPALRRSLDAVRAGTPVTLNVMTQARR